MDGDPEFLINPLSYILGAVAFIGFLIVLWNEGKLRIQRVPIGQRRAQAALSGTSSAPVISRSSARWMRILGLVFLGLLFSVVIFVSNEKIERLNANISLFGYMLILFGFIMLPGVLTGVSAGMWIKATRQGGSCDMLGSLIVGLLVYIALIVLVEFSDVDPLLFFCGPVVTLLVNRYSELVVAEPAN